MGKGRTEAFSDGVIAIIITIMVLQLKPPHAEDWRSMLPLWPVFLAYVLSFIYVGIYWNNHHHLFQAVKRVNGSVLWANLHLLFWLSLMPFATDLMGENQFSTVPVILYGVDLFMCAVAYYILSRCLLRIHAKDSELAHALGKDAKGRLSAIAYILAVFAAALSSWLSLAIYVCVAIVWLIPDRRIEKAIG
jgi:uncharacterized membrane protein